MGYKVFLQLNPDEDPVLVHEITDRRVKRVGLSGTQGEAGALGVAPGDTQVTLSFDYAPASGAPTLEDLEAITHPSEQTGEDVAARRAQLDGLPTATNGSGVESAPESEPGDDEFEGPDADPFPGASSDVTFGGLDAAPQAEPSAEASAFAAEGTAPGA